MNDIWMVWVPMRWYAIPRECKCEGNGGSNSDNVWMSNIMDGHTIHTPPCFNGY